ncbi:MAG: ferritin [Candidatus Thorarchaeota archaeon]|jgi:ferritin
MEIDKELVDAINDQLNFELYSAFIYLSMGTWLEEQSLTGMAHWMEVQYQEEFAHAMRFYRHLTERGARVVMKEIRCIPSRINCYRENLQDRRHC